MSRGGAACNRPAHSSCVRSNCVRSYSRPQYLSVRTREIYCLLPRVPTASCRVEVEFRFFVVLALSVAQVVPKILCTHSLILLPPTQGFILTKSSAGLQLSSQPISTTLRRSGCTDSLVASGQLPCNSSAATAVLLVGLCQHTAPTFDCHQSVCATV